MYQLILRASLTEIDGPEQKRVPKSSDIVVCGTHLDDVRMIMADRGPANAFFNCVERLLSEAELTPRTPEPAAELPAPAGDGPNTKEHENGVGASTKGKKNAKGRGNGPDRAEVGAVPAGNGAPEGASAPV